MRIDHVEIPPELEQFFEMAFAPDASYILRSIATHYLKYQDRSPAELMTEAVRHLETLNRELISSNTKLLSLQPPPPLLLDKETTEAFLRNNNLTNTKIP